MTDDEKRMIWYKYLFGGRYPITHKHAIDWKNALAPERRNGFVRAVNNVRGDGFI